MEEDGEPGSDYKSSSKRKHFPPSKMLIYFPRQNLFSSLHSIIFLFVQKLCHRWRPETNRKTSILDAHRFGEWKWIQWESERVKKILRKLHFVFDLGIWFNVHFRKEERKSHYGLVAIELRFYWDSRSTQFRCRWKENFIILRLSSDMWKWIGLLFLSTATLERKINFNSDRKWLLKYHPAFNSFQHSDSCSSIKVNLEMC